MSARQALYQPSRSLGHRSVTAYILRVGGTLQAWQPDLPDSTCVLQVPGCDRAVHALCFSTIRGCSFIPSCPGLNNHTETINYNTVQPISSGFLLTNCYIFFFKIYLLCIQHSASIYARMQRRAPDLSTDGCESPCGSGN